MEYIKLKKDNIFRVGIMDQNGNVKRDENGNEVVIEFDLENIETPTNYSKCYHLIKKADAKLQQQMKIIEKQQDSKGKGLMSKNEEATINALKTYYKEVEEAMDLFNTEFPEQKSVEDDKEPDVDKEPAESKVEIDQAEEGVQESLKEEDPTPVADQVENTPEENCFHIYEKDGNIITRYKFC